MDEFDISNRLAPFGLDLDCLDGNTDNEYDLLSEEDLDENRTANFSSLAASRVPPSPTTCPIFSTCSGPASARAPANPRTLAAFLLLTAAATYVYHCNLAPSRATL
jgi:hypothetical protein